MEAPFISGCARHLSADETNLHVNDVMEVSSVNSTSTSQSWLVQLQENRSDSSGSARPGLDQFLVSIDLYLARGLIICSEMLVPEPVTVSERLKIHHFGNVSWLSCSQYLSSVLLYFATFIFPHQKNL